MAAKNVNGFIQKLVGAGDAIDAQLTICCLILLSIAACKTGKAPSMGIGPSPDGEAPLTDHGPSGEAGNPTADAPRAGGAGTPGAGGTQGSGGADAVTTANQPDGASLFPKADGAAFSDRGVDTRGLHPDGKDSGNHSASTSSKTTVVIFVIDGMMADAAQTAAQNGATHLKFVMDNGVTVAAVRTTSPAIRIELPGGVRPWGSATSGNVSMHTGTHLFEANSTGMDDIFLATQAAGIKSVYSGGDANYAIFKTATFPYGKAMEDNVVVDNAIKHLKNDGARLFRLHLQRVRDSWTGAGDKTNPNSAYIRKIIAADGLLGNLIAALKEAGVWETTYLIIAADHGMGGSRAPHPANLAASWEPYLAFYGPGLKKGATIPYAELPDVAVTTMHFFGLPPLKGHTNAAVHLPVKGPTGTVLMNLFEGQNPDMPHPRYIDQYLKQGTFTSAGDSYAPYRTFMLGLLR